MPIDPVSVSHAPANAGAPHKRVPEAKVVDAARQFESLLIAQMMKSMRESGSQGWMGTGEDQTGASAMELAEEQFAKAISAAGGLGIAKMVEAGLKAGG